MSKLANTYRPDILKDFLSVAELSQDAIVWLNQEGHITFVNSVLVQRLGYTKAELFPKTVFEIDPHLNLFKFRAYWQRILDEQKVDIDTEHLHAAGFIMPVRVTAVRFATDEETLAMCVVRFNLPDKLDQEVLEMTREAGQVATWEWNKT